MESDVVIRKDHNGVACITLNRPDSLNSVTPELAEGLARAVNAAGNDEAIRSILITGAGRAFCSGGDIKAMSKNLADGKPAELIRGVVASMNDAIKEIQGAPKPVVACINGVAAGAGLGIALSCDLRIAAAGAELLTSFLSIGLSPDSSTSYFLPRLVGLSKATEILFLNRPLSAEEALAHGLVYRVVASEQLWEESLNVAQTLARGPTRALARAKRLLRRSLLSTLEDQLDLEAYWITSSSMTEDFSEGVDAFLSRRPSKFKGR